MPRGTSSTYLEPRVGSQLASRDLEGHTSRSRAKANVMNWPVPGASSGKDHTPAAPWASSGSSPEKSPTLDPKRSFGSNPYAP